MTTEAFVAAVNRAVRWLFRKLGGFAANTPLNSVADTAERKALANNNNKVWNVGHFSRFPYLFRHAEP